MGVYEESGGSFGIPDVPSAGRSGLLSSVGGMLAGLNPVVAGLGAFGGLSGMFGGGGTSDIAESGGTFYTGEITHGGKPFDTNTLIIVAAFVVGLLLIFRGKK